MVAIAVLRLCVRLVVLLSITVLGLAVVRLVLCVEAQYDQSEI